MEAAARVGLLALEHISRRAHDERGIKHFQSSSNDADIMRVMEVCVAIGQSKFDQFCNGSRNKKLFNLNRLFKF